MAQKFKSIGILTAGGDCPGLNAAIRGVAKSAMHHGIKVLGALDGFRGLVENRFTEFSDLRLSGLLTMGGTILGTSRDKPHKYSIGGKTMDMTQVAVENARKAGIDCLVCLGGNGTQKNALRLHESGLPVISLPKTIDNDVWGTDISFGFDTALNIATEAIDRLHTTATSHHRIIVCELMGHDAGWLTLASGIAGGADVILIPEIPYDMKIVTEHLQARRRAGKRFSIIAVAEGIQTLEKVTAEKVALEKISAATGTPSPDKPTLEKRSATEEASAEDEGEDTEEASGDARRKKKNKRKPVESISGDNGTVFVPEPVASRIAREITALVGTEARVTSLGHVQRGGTPSATDRLLCTRLGTRVGDLLNEGKSGLMVAIRGSRCEPVPLAEAASRKKLVPLDHEWIRSARLVETCFGDAS